MAVLISSLLHINSSMSPSATITVLPLLSYNTVSFGLILTLAHRFWKTSSYTLWRHYLSLLLSPSVSKLQILTLGKGCLEKHAVICAETLCSSGHAGKHCEAAYQHPSLHTTCFPCTEVLASCGLLCPHCKGQVRRDISEKQGDTSKFSE